MERPLNLFVTDRTYMLKLSTFFCSEPSEKYGNLRLMEPPKAFTTARARTASNNYSESSENVMRALSFLSLSLSLSCSPSQFPREKSHALNFVVFGGPAHYQSEVEPTL